MNLGINWIRAYNLLWILLDRSGSPTYHSGPSFLRMVQQINPSSYSYEQLIPLRQSQGLSTSRKSFYWDVIQELQDQQKLQLFRLFIEELEPYAKDEVSVIRDIVFGGGSAVPTTIVPYDLWSSEKLNQSLRDMEHAIDAQQFNRATTLSYTCLEGLYKAYVRKHVIEKANLSDLMQLCKVVKDDISEKLKAQGPYPEQIVNALPTLTNAVANSRNSFSESHFSENSHRWLAIFARDMTNSVGRLLLHFI